MSDRDVVVLSAVRSAIGAFGGGLSDIEPHELGGMVMKEAVTRSGADPARINYVTVGNCIPTDARYPYVARVASIQAGLPMESVAMAVNRLCSSGLQAVVSTAQNIKLGDCDMGVGGGVEVMSRGVYMSTAMRKGARMGDTTLLDSMVSALTDPFGVGHMGVTAENLAEKWGISREEQDELAAESHRRAAAAMAEGRFKDQIVPIVKKTRKGEVTVDTDEHVLGEFPDISDDTLIIQVSGFVDEVAALRGLGRLARMCLDLPQRPSEELRGPARDLYNRSAGGQVRALIPTGDYFPEAGPCFDSNDTMTPGCWRFA
jgi:acetyl-CoA C-acetyltransferase